MVKEDIGLTDTEKAYLQVAAEDGDIERGDVRLKERGVADSYLDRPDRLEGKIEDRVRTLPDRLNDLFEEIELLTESGHINPDAWQEHEWSDGLYEEVYSPHNTDLPYASDTPQLHRLEPTFADQFGRRLGKLAIGLMFCPPGSDPSDVLLDLQTGFISGFYSDFPIGAADEQLKQLSDVIDQDLANTREFVDNLEDERQLPDWERKFRDELNSHLVETLQENGIEVSTPTWYDPLIRDLKSQFSLYSLGVTARDMGPSPPDVIAENEVSELFTKDKIMGYVRDNRLVERQHLATLVSEDAEEFTDISWNGIPVADVVCQTPPDGASIGDIGEEVADRKSRGLPAVAALSQYLSGDEHPSLGSRNKPAVVEVDDTPPSMSDWRVKLTHYGCVTQSHVDSRSRVAVSDLRSAPEESVNQVLDEIPLEEYV